MAAREGAAGVRRVTRLLAMKTAGPVLKSGGPILLLRHSTTQVVPADDRIKISSFIFFEMHLESVGVACGGNLHSALQRAVELA